MQGIQWGSNPLHERERERERKREREKEREREGGEGVRGGMGIEKWSK